MRLFLTVLIIFSLFLVGCQEDEEITFQETGLVVDYAGAGNCNFVIELDNGNRIQPIYYPDGFTFFQFRFNRPE